MIDVETGEELGRGYVPPWSVAVSATRPRQFPGGEFGLPCVAVIKRLTEGERHDKAQLNVDPARPRRGPVTPGGVGADAGAGDRRSDLLALAAELVDIPFGERPGGGAGAPTSSAVWPTLPWLELTRVGDNLVARTDLGRAQRLVLAGHTDTVPANGNAGARIEGDRLQRAGRDGHEGRPGRHGAAGSHRVGRRPST